MKLFSQVSTVEGSEKYELAIERKQPLYKKPEDIRSEFSRDYNRILHCNAFRRLKHKTQVFYATMNDHICTRIEHVHHVESVSRTICDELGLNSELAVAIALGHDLGHAPFGHEGEKIISKISKEKIGKSFWHEKNSLRVVDYIESLPDTNGVEKPLNLTYAVRDGIISHCGEVDINALKPRSENIDLCKINEPNEYQPFTWEGCVVKLADKIAYLGRDIEDAWRLNVINKNQITELNDIISKKYAKVTESVFTTSLMHNFIIDLCDNSSIESGLKFSDDTYNLMKNIKSFNYKNIYSHPRIKRYNKYVELIITTLFDFLIEKYNAENTINEIKKDCANYPELCRSFADWLSKYSIASETQKNEFNIFDINDLNQYTDCVLTYLSLMTDQYAMRLFGEITHF